MNLRFFLTAFIAIMSLLAGILHAAETPPKPNILVFLVDDMGWQDTSVPFWTEKTPINETFATPNMERLADRGMKFTQAYSCCVCSPTRISLMSGMNAARHRVTNWILHPNEPTDKKNGTLLLPDWNTAGMQPVPDIPYAVQVTPLPQLLHDNGYFTIHCGKAHFGGVGTPGADPSTFGFDINIAGHAAGSPGSYQGLDDFGFSEKHPDRNEWAVPGLEKYWGKDIHLTEVLTIEALKALDTARASGKPFFLYMAHYAVHTPIQPDKRFYQKYKDKGYDDIEAKYASMIEGMDKSLGDLMDYLDKNDLTQNTVILFTSDNGGLSCHARGGKANTHNAPLNSGKGSAYEGGIREPMLVSWPGVTQPQSACDDYLIIEDFFPTILDIAGIHDYTTLQHVDGVSFVPLLKHTGESPAKNRDLFWHYPNLWGCEGPGIGTTSTIRSGDWKLIYWYKDRHVELYNIKNDIGETNNLAGQHPEKAQELSAKLGAYLRHVDAQRPSDKATGKPIPWPGE